MTEHRSAHPGGEFIFDLYADDVDPLWGKQGCAIWQAGEPLMIAGQTGVGKSAIAQQLVLARIGVHESVFLDRPVQVLEKNRKVLYLAMDRPRQIQRSFQRMVDKDRDRRTLDKRLLVYAGPLAHLKVTSDPFSLLAWVEDEYSEADDLVVDSLKDLAVGLSNDDVGAAVNSALQHVIASGREVIACHHTRKAQQGNRSPVTLDDVYGSNWLTAGMGSVVLIDGEPGAISVEFKHLKPIDEPVGPMALQHNKSTGLTRVADTSGGVFEALAASNGAGVTLEEVALTVFYSTTEAAKARARRELKKLTDDGTAEYLEGKSGGKGGGGRSARWALHGLRRSTER